MSTSDVRQPDAETVDLSDTDSLRVVVTHGAVELFPAAASPDAGDSRTFHTLFGADLRSGRTGEEGLEKDVEESDPRGVAGLLRLWSCSGECERDEVLVIAVRERDEGSVGGACGRAGQCGDGGVGGRGLAGRGG